MTKRPEIIDYLLANGAGLPQAPKAIEVPAASGVCAGSQSVFDQAIDFDFPDAEQDCCQSKAQHDIHVKTITQTAKAICAGCPIAQSCAAWAVANNEPGIWGGLTMTERKQRFGVASITLDKASELLEEYEFLENASVEAICRKYEAVPRSVARWRKTMRSQLELAA